MKIRIKGKLPKAQLGMSADDQMNKQFYADNPMMPSIPTSLEDMGIGPQYDPYTQQYNSDPRYQRKYDRNLFSHHLWNNDADIEDYMAFYSKKYPNNFWNIKNRVENIAGGMAIGATALSALATPFINKKKQKEFDRWQRQNRLSDNMFAPGAGGDRGDYDVLNGMFKPNELGFKSKGMYTNSFYGPMNFAEYGGENIKAMKIKITGIPQSMAYGGQAEGGYGLDLGSRRVYDFQNGPSSKEESVRSNIQEVPREYANIEAEKGETIYGDLDNDGNLEQLNVGGKKHSQGGTPLSVPEGSFVFSDTKNMRIKDEEILSIFGLKPRAGGYTPAEIAKRYNINKYKAILEDKDSDDLAKETAQLMVQNYTNKLSKLSMLQEAMKGFPSGVPSVAQAKMQKGGTVKTDNVFTNDFQNFLARLKSDDGYDLMVSPRMLSGDNTLPVLQHKQKTGLYGDVLNDELGEFKQRHDWYFTNKPNWNASNPADVLDFQTKYDEEFAKQKKYSYFPGDRAFNKKDSKFGEYTYNAPGLRKNEVQKPMEPLYACDPNGGGVISVNPTSANKFTATFKTYEEALAACTAKQPDIDRPDAGGTPPIAKSNTPWGYMTPDLVNMAAAGARPPKKYLPFIADTPFESGAVTFEDWRGKAAARQSAYNTAANMLAQYAPGTSLASNEAFMAGLAGEGVTGDISGVDARNVQIANIFNSQERQRKDQNNLLRSTNATQRYQGNVIANQNYDNAMREYYNRLAKSFGQAWSNRMNLGLVNSVNPMFNILPRSGKSIFKGGYGIDQLAGRSGGQSSMDFRTVKSQLMQQGYSESLAERKADQIVSGNKAQYTDYQLDGIPDMMRYNAPINPNVIYKMLSQGFPMGGYNED